MSTPTPYVVGAVLGAADLNDNFEAVPHGYTGLASATSSQLGVTTIVDLTSLTLTFTAPGGRRYLISGIVRCDQASTAGRVAVYISTSTSVIQKEEMNLQVGERATFTPWTVITPSAGSVTYKLRLSTSAGTVDALADVAYPNQLLIMDIGPS